MQTVIIHRECRAIRLSCAIHGNLVRLVSTKTTWSVFEMRTYFIGLNMCTICDYCSFLAVNKDCALATNIYLYMHIRTKYPGTLFLSVLCFLLLHFVQSKAAYISMTSDIRGQSTIIALLNKDRPTSDFLETEWIHYWYLCGL